MDTQLFMLINHATHPVLDAVMWWISELGRGDYAVFLVGMVLVAVQRKVHWVSLASLVVAAVLAGVLTSQIKSVVDRPRPLATLNNKVRVVGEELRKRSFPSGHTSSAFALLVVACRRMRQMRQKRAWGLGAVLAGSVGYSRIYVGAHYPADVLAGALLGMMCGELTYRMSLRVEAWWAARRKARATESTVETHPVENGPG